MNYRLLNKEECDLITRMRNLPDMILSDLDLLYLFGGFDGSDNLVAVAAFSDCMYDKRAINLRYIYVLPSMRGMNISKELLVNSVMAFRELGIFKVQHEMICEAQDAYSYYKLLTNLGFRPERLSEPVYYYKRGHFKGEKTDLLYKNIEKMKLEFSNDLEYTDIRVRRLMEMHEKTGIFIAEEDYDKDCVVYAIRNDKIVAALCIYENAEHDFICDGMYIDEELKEGISVVPFMMSYLVKNLSTSRQEVQGIFVTFRRESVKTAVDSVFSIEDEKFYNQKYALNLQTKM